MLKIIKLLKTAYSILSNELKISNSNIDPIISSKIIRKFNSSKIKKDFQLNKILTNVKIGNLKIKKNWFFNTKTKEWNLVYENSIFGEGVIRIFFPKNYKKTLIFFPGTLTSSDDVLTNTSNKFYLKRMCEKDKIALICWDWPLNGSRLKNGLIKNITRYTTLEREYEKIFSIFNSSLFIEYINELVFIFKILSFKLKNNNINVCGWSMGGFFSYYAPFCGLKIKKVISAGSCALVEDLLYTGKFVSQGHFFFNNLNGYTADLDQIININLKNNVEHYIAFGENDKNCLLKTSSKLKKMFSSVKYKKKFEIKIFPKIGHEFSLKIKDYIFSKV